LCDTSATKPKVNVDFILDSLPIGKITGIKVGISRKKTTK